jgi:hypothetical protein
VNYVIAIELEGDVGIESDGLSRRRELVGRNLQAPLAPEMCDLMRPAPLKSNDTLLKL